MKTFTPEYTKHQQRRLVKIIAALLLLVLLTAPVWAQTVTNMPIVCPTAAGQQAAVANCTNQFQRPVAPTDFVLSCGNTSCLWDNPDLKWRTFESVPSNYFIAACPAARPVGVMDCPGAASVVWGGLVYLPKAQVATAAVVPPAATNPLPPLTAGDNYVVTWTPPTTNTDGTPIGPLLKTYIQASTSSTFATYYQWEAAVPTASSITVVNGPLGTVYWRARVQTADGLSDYSATAITERTYIERNKPTCWPKPVGAGTWVKASQNADGFALYWQCDDNGVKKHAGFVGLWADLKPDWMTQLATAVATSSLDALWTANITGPTQAARYVAVQPLYIALRDANPLPVVTTPTYRVKVNGTSTSRPAYTVSGGVRSSVLAGRVAVGAPCDCAVFKSGDYCAVTGQSNVATAAVDVLPGSAAICAAP